jgi:hypothetical protein
MNVRTKGTLGRTPFSAIVNLCSLPAELPSGRAGVPQKFMAAFLPAAGV